MTRRVVIVGAGIVGAALAADLSAEADLDVTVIERGPRDRLLGSTGHAPGFVGLLNEEPVMTAMARNSADAYESIRHDGLAGFDRVGGLEIATTTAGADDLRRRAGLAAEQGLPVRLVDAAQAAAAAPGLVDKKRCTGGVLYPRDGTARSGVITAALTKRAMSNRARFIYETAVTDIEVRAGRVHALQAGETQVAADDVVLACGIWGPTVAALAGQVLPLTPVVHPYVYGPTRDVPRAAAPFVRWPEHHVYARDHGDRFGLGTYDHAPIPIKAGALDAGAEQPWRADIFDPAVQRALELLSPGQRFTPVERLGGVFAMTADNRPLVGPVGDVAGLWAVEAVWVTHAAGAARGLAELMTGKPTTIGSLHALRPSRFDHRSTDDLTASALRLYRDIYAVD